MSKFPKFLMWTFDLLTLTLVLVSVVHHTEGKNQYVLPLNMGMKVSIPYDIANLFNRFPIQGALSVCLAVALAGLIFFGVITAPFGYFFGVPSKKYVLGDLQTHPQEATTVASRLWEDWDESFIKRMDVVGEMNLPLPPPRPLRLKPSPRKLITEETLLESFLKEIFHSEMDDLDWNSIRSNETGLEDSVFSERSQESITDLIWKYYVNLVNNGKKYTSTFMESMFYLMPKDGSVRSSDCDLFTICYAHGALKRLPNWVLKIYQIFSGKLGSIPLEYKRAILTGMKDEGKCLDEDYSKACPETPFTLVLKSYLNFLPKKALSKEMPKRKGAMYL